MTDYGYDDMPENGMICGECESSERFCRCRNAGSGGYHYNVALDDWEDNDNCSCH
jgi:putative component of membrane protein insertase Oxa1/YidC/SpoIIIJ protein YidD